MLYSRRRHNHIRTLDTHMCVPSADNVLMTQPFLFVWSTWTSTTLPLTRFKEQQYLHKITSSASNPLSFIKVPMECISFRLLSFLLSFFISLPAFVTLFRSSTYLSLRFWTILTTSGSMRPRGSAAKMTEVSNLQHLTQGPEWYQFHFGLPVSFAEALSVLMSVVFLIYYLPLGIVHGCSSTMLKFWWTQLSFKRNSCQ